MVDDMKADGPSNSVISMIVPTRGRPERLKAFLDSVKTRTSRLERLQIILVTDRDDRSYDRLRPDGLALRRVVVAPGLPMGELHRAGYAASAGDYVMLLNDDVVLRTPGWDDQVLAAARSIDDGIVLIHVNDLYCVEKLCTFPFLTRTFCERVGGICPGGFRRYLIDVHIYNIFNLLSVLGHHRILYLPDVVFEHLNFVRTATGGKEYRPDEALLKLDTELFDTLLAERKALAVALARFIDERRARQADTVRAHLLAPITDSESVRKPEYVRFWYADCPPSDWSLILARSESEFQQFKSEGDVLRALRWIWRHPRRVLVAAWSFAFRGWEKRFRYRVVYPLRARGRSLLHALHHTGKDPLTRPQAAGSAKRKRRGVSAASDSADGAKSHHVEEKRECACRP